MKRPCIECGQPYDNRGSLCGGCLKGRPPRRPDLHTPQWKQHRKRALEQHRAIHGNTCPGYQRAPHPTPDLTVDHITDLADGGDPNGPTQILCRSCNGRKGALNRAKGRGHPSGRGIDP